MRALHGGRGLTALHPKVANLLAAPLLLVALSLAASASETRANESPGRYTMTPAADGFLKLDTATGAVSVCREVEGAFVCKAVADDAAAMSAEIDRLAKENERLRSGEMSGDPLAAVPPDQSAPLKLPSDKDIDQAMGFIEKMLKRFKTLMDDLKSQPDTKSL